MKSDLVVSRNENPLDIDAPFHLSPEENRTLFSLEIERAMKWLMDIQDKTEHGWGWLQHIPPNEQNTAEVICGMLAQDVTIDKSTTSNLILAIDKFLIDPSKTAKITIDWIWVLRALGFIEKKINIFGGYYRLNHIYEAKEKCLEWLVQSQNQDGGWGDAKGDYSSVSRTAIVIYNLIDSVDPTYLKEQFHIQNALAKAEKWLMKNIINKCSWGNIHKQELNNYYNQYQVISVDKIEYQYMPNPACTAYAILALHALNPHKHNKTILKASQWLIKEQEKTGGWQVFFEIGYRDGKIFTFRHFSTAWALLALLKSKSLDFQDNVILDAMEYVISLQDPICGGWRTSHDTDPFTWATCNILEVLKEAQDQTKNLSSTKFIAILKEWRRLKMEKEVRIWKFRNVVLAFNNSMFFLFALSCTFVTLLTIVIFMLVDWEFLKRMKFIYPVIFAIMLSVPWIFHLRFAIKKPLSWVESIALVTGTVIGILGISFGYIFN